MHQKFLEIEMLKYFLFSLILTVQGDSLSREDKHTDANKDAERVVGGAAAPDGAVPHQVAIRVPKEDNWLFCGGAIIEKRWIMTAAHCLVKIKPKDIVAAAGTNLRRGGTEYKISKFIIHEKYDRTSFANDIALMLTEEEIEFSDKVKPVKLASRNTDPGAKCLLTGWGYTNQKGTKIPDKLQWLNVTALSVYNCQKQLKAFQKKNPFTKKQICTLTKRGEGTCQGDSGGALIENGEAVGVASYNLPCAYGVPDVFTRVYEYLDWIKARMDENTTKI
ncbi:chymotrypsin-2-like [Pieris napi]|uniref:chymotrypsin-2-like n=1 Tax=Pieris napi TaxID=78633 RepID=UPI001FBA397B|nr:chymotrypsin-2-like [Pieris napi]